MKIGSLFSVLGRQLSSRFGAQKPEKDVLPPTLPKAEAFGAVVDDSFIKKFMEKAETLQREGFVYYGSSSEAAKALCNYLAMTTGEPVMGSGFDFCKQRNNGDWNIIGLATKGDRRIAENYFVVQVDVTPKGHVTMPKYIGLLAFLDQIKNQNIEAFFENMPRATMNTKRDQMPRLAVG